MGKTVKAIIGIVAIAAIVYFAPYLAPAIASLGVSTSVAVAIASAIVSTVISVGLGFVFKALGIGSVPSAKAQTGPPQVFRQSITNSFIVYGKRRVGGLLVFFHAKQSGSDHFRYFVVAVAGHRCQGVVTWMLNDEAVTVDGGGMVTSGKYANAAWLWFQRGLASETANATFVAECDGNWTSAHKGNGVAAIYAKFKLTDDVVQAGMPNITAVIEGRDEILDYRTGAVGYSRNAALVFYDWMTIPREEGGFGAYDDEVPLASWISAQANVCDESVHGSPRYAFDAVITTGAAPSEVRDAMVVNCAGTYTYSGGKHLMRPGYWVPVTVNLSEADLAGPIQVTPFFPADSAANEVQGTYISPADGYQGMPFTTQSLAGADIRQLDLDLAFITTKDQADRVARIMLNRAACEKQVVWPMNIAGIGIRALDTVQLDTSRYGLSNYAWTVSTWGLSSDFGVVLNVREENAEIYDEPTPVTPATPPTIVQPSRPLETDAELMQMVLSSTVSGLTFTVNAAGVSTVSNHSRIYPDKTVSVIGATVAAPAGVVAGDLVGVYYGDHSRVGGAEIYASFKLVAGQELPGPGPGQPDLHMVGVATVPASGTTTATSAIGTSDPGTSVGGMRGGWANEP